MKHCPIIMDESELGWHAQHLSIICSV